MEVKSEAPSMGLFLIDPLMDPGVNAWAREKISGPATHDSDTTQNSGAEFLEVIMTGTSG